MTVRQWLDKNLDKLHEDTRLYHIYRRIQQNLQFAKMHAASKELVYEADVSEYINDENYPLEGGKL